MCRVFCCVVPVVSAIIQQWSTIHHHGQKTANIIHLDFHVDSFIITLTLAIKLLRPISSTPNSKHFLGETISRCCALLLVPKW